MTTPNNWTMNIWSAKVSLVSLATLRRRANRKFGRGTVQLQGSSFVRFNTPGGVFQYNSWDGACGAVQAATYRMDIPVINMLTALGILAITKLHISTRRDGEKRLPHKWEAV